MEWPTPPEIRPQTLWRPYAAYDQTQAAILAASGLLIFELVLATGRSLLAGQDIVWTALIARLVLVVLLVWGVRWARLVLLVVLTVFLVVVPLALGLLFQQYRSAIAYAVYLVAILVLLTGRGGPGRVIPAAVIGLIAALVADLG
jgi:hypothetical protein